ncbi:MAG: inositol monophosphatase [Acidobacteriota bacterium]|nr:inositol monophosphatase [Acidobacteriota bacterium]
MSPDPVFLATAVEAVVRAGDIHLAKFGTGVRIDKKGAIDLVTEVDLEVERMFRAMIAERFPAHDVLAEELGGTSTGARHRWVFDPLDGTTNFAHGVPIFCASLALEIDGQAEVGAVYDATRQELFTAERGVGAWLNGDPLRVSQTNEILDALLVTGFPYTVHETPQRFMPVFTAFVSRARAVRRLGSAAIDLCYVAAGRMDGFWEESLQPWDTRAGALIVEQAGGCVTGMDGQPWVPANGHILASNGALHDAMLAILRGAP